VKEKNSLVLVVTDKWKGTSHDLILLVMRFDSPSEKYTFSFIPASTTLCFIPNLFDIYAYFHIFLIVFILVYIYIYLFYYKYILNFSLNTMILCIELFNLKNKRSKIYFTFLILVPAIKDLMHLCWQWSLLFLHRFKFFQEWSNRCALYFFSFIFPTIKLKKNVMMFFN